VSHVSIEGLTKRFDGKPPTVAVDDLDLELEEGEFLVLLGPSGCGKTTTLRCVAGLERPDRGSIEIAGQIVDSVTGEFTFLPSGATSEWCSRAMRSGPI
jgi:iron(III) transport system ATP-binding protein